MSGVESSPRPWIAGVQECTESKGPLSRKEGLHRQSTLPLSRRISIGSLVVPVTYVLFGRLSKQIKIP